MIRWRQWISRICAIRRAMTVVKSAHPAIVPPLFSGDRRNRPTEQGVAKEAANASNSGRQKRSVRVSTAVRPDSGGAIIGFRAHMSGLSLILQSVLGCILVVLALLSAQLGTLALVRAFAPARRVRRPDLADAPLPQVLVQLPVCDEGRLAVRVAAAAAQLDWPRDRLEIQLLDDGRAENHDALSQAVHAVVPENVNLQVLRRGVRTGFQGRQSGLRPQPFRCAVCGDFRCRFRSAAGFPAAHGASAGRRSRACLCAGALGTCQPRIKLAHRRAGLSARQPFRR